MKILKDEYGEYYSRYIKLSNEKSLTGQLKNQKDEVLQLIGGLSDEEALYRYEKGKWSVKEVLGHITDTERIFCYRALAFARGENTSLPGFDQDAYVDAAGFDSQPLQHLVEQYGATRDATILLFSGLDDEVLLRRGVASGFPFTVRALGYTIAGHERHHLNILEERYLM